MGNAKHVLENTKDKIVGEVKAAVGKATGNDELELEGNIQSTGADLKALVEKITDR
jgi:uncharacterized protein YjbJ (UPF0337 family)